MAGPLATQAPSADLKVWRWAAAGNVLGLLLTLLLAAPARWLQPWVEQATAGQVVLADAQGTLWNGSAQLQLSGGTGSQDRSALATRVHWQLQLQLEGLQLVLQSDCCTPQPMTLQWRPDWHGGVLKLLPGDSQWPASLLAGLGTPWNTVQLEGSLQLHSGGLTLQQAQGRTLLQGVLTLTAPALASRLSTLRPLGSYRLDLQAGGLAHLQLQTLQGSLQLQGSGSWVGGRFHFQGEASAAPEHEAALANLLNILGRRDGARSLITLG
jgi:general secretion pathway protein N